ncbi:MAG: DNA/RNA nuclease SfsA [bacterium]|jgi:sugar fermentation stimulation protein A
METRESQIKYPEPLQQGLFIARKNRFVALVDLHGEQVIAHIPSSGRMHELLYHGAKVFLLPRRDVQRKTSFDLVVATQDDILVSIDSHLPNRLIAYNLREGLILGFDGAIEVEQEVTYQTSRLDFRIRQEQQICFMEVKSVTLVENGQALFPDAPTARGTRHVAELMLARQEGYRAVALFVIQRNDASIFSPNKRTDPEFSAALYRAQQTGVEVYAYDCQVALEGISLGNMVPVV